MQPKRVVVDMDLPDYTDVLTEAEQVIRQCLTKYKLEELFLSFNGGKDCTVLLDITINILKDIYQRENIAEDLKVVYIRTKGPFKEIESFVKHIEEYYGVTLVITEGEMKMTLQKLLKEDSRLKACLMGTRRTDPYSENLNFMQKTDPSWPQIVRVSPLLNWSYHHVWSYILKNNVPYCSLYNVGENIRQWQLSNLERYISVIIANVKIKANSPITESTTVAYLEFQNIETDISTYTSIGSTMNTWPNPSLTYHDDNGRLSYLPAWKLTDGSLERAGRGTAPTQTVNRNGAMQNHLSINGSSTRETFINGSDNQNHMSKKEIDSQNHILAKGTGSCVVTNHTLTNVSDNENHILKSGSDSQNHALKNNEHTVRQMFK